MRATQYFPAAFLLLAGFLTSGGVEFLTPAGGFGHIYAWDTSRAENRSVARVIDGDTIVLYPNEKVRLIGVDAPETAHPKRGVECFGHSAKEFTRLAVWNKPVRLVLDQANLVRGHRDRYGRTLGYIYRADGMLLNAELIRRGYARAYTRFPFRFIVEFRELERHARSQGLGLWSSCSPTD